MTFTLQGSVMASAEHSLPYDRLASAVALVIQGTTSLAAVGATATNNNTVSPNISESGAVFLFSGPTWFPATQVLFATDGVIADYFGAAVAMSLDQQVLVIGAPGKNTAIGAAYVFTNSGGTWTQQAKLLANLNGLADGVPGDMFGAAVAIDGPVNGLYTIVIGAPGRAPTGPSGSAANAGVAFVFTGSGSTWTQQAALRPPTPRGNEFFGQAVAVRDSSIVVGAPGVASSSGAVYVYGQRSSGAWQLQSTLRADVPTPGDNFGAAVSISKNYSTAAPPYQYALVVGTECASAAATREYAYVFTTNQTSATPLQWSVSAVLIGVSGSGSVISSTHNLSTPAHQYFGNSVSISPDASTIAIGAYNQDYTTSYPGGGMVYVFTASSSWPPSWSQPSSSPFGCEPYAPSQTNQRFGFSVAVDAASGHIGSYITLVAGMPYLNTQFNIGPAVIHSGGIACALTGP